MNSEFLFSDDDTDSIAFETNFLAPWHILIVDDDSDVHMTTKFAFTNVTHLERAISFSSAFSGLHAISLILESRHNLPDLVLMDVVMETPTDGIDTTHRIRQLLEQRHSPYVIIRTGQAGVVSDERALIDDPDVDDVVFKQEMTQERLKTAVFRGLEMIVKRRTEIIQPTGKDC
jgi:CheY-like chemotaxis protein